MTDDEILAALKRADELLDEYKRVAGPAVKELARQLSLAVGKREGHYDGQFGCYDEGIDTLCLHLDKEAQAHFNKSDDREEYYRKRNEFLGRWRTVGRADGLRHVSLDVHG